MAEEQEIIPPVSSQPPSLGEKVFGKTAGEEELKQRQRFENIQTGFDRDHQTAFPINTDINSSIIGNFKTGPTPGAKVEPNGDFARNIVSYLNQADSWAKDKNAYGKTSSYGAGYRNMNFDRYYSQSGFKKLGFSPFKDNEKIYNEKTSGAADFGRMASGWMGMAGLGVKDLFSEWTDYGLNSDVVHSEEMNKRMGVMTSSRDNTMGWITNFGANTAYTAGILAELAAEEIALAGATALTAGGAIEVTAPLGAARGAMGFKRIAEGFSAMNNIKKSLSTIRSVNDARQLFTLANAGEKALGAAKWLNPLSRTAEFTGELSSLNNLTNFAKLKRGVGSLYRDIREINAVTSESKLEGGSTQNEVNQKLINDFYEKNGRLPEGEEAEKIYDQAKKAGFAATLSNIPLIYFSNKIVLKTALRGFKPLESFLEGGAEGVLAEKILVKDQLAKSAKFVNKYSIPGVKNIFKPGNFFKGSLNYTLANLTEGIQESSQDVISAAFKDYYEQDYKDPDLASLKSSFSKGLGTQLSAQGFDTFLSGFLMGGALQAPQRVLFEGVPTLTKKIFNPEGYKAYQAAKEEYINSVTNSINDATKDPARYVKAISSIDKNFVLQRKSNSNVDQSIDENDQKAFQDTKDESVFNHIYTLLKSGQTSSLTEQVNALKELSTEELSEAFGEKTDANSLPERLDSFLDKVDYLKDRFDILEKKMVNPFDPSKISDPRERLNEYVAKEEFDELKKMALFSRYSFDRTLERMSNITQDAAANKPLSKASSTDFILLFSPDQIQNEINTLKLEVSTYKGTTDRTGKQLAKKKQAKLDALQDLKLDIVGFQSALKSRSKSITPDEKELDNQASAEHAKLMFDSYKKYIKIIAGISGDHILDENVTNSFRGLKDFYEVNDDSVNLASAVNYLLNPETFRELHARAVEVRKVAEENRATYLKEGLQEFVRKSENNVLMNELYNLGVFFAPEEVDALIDHNKIPTRFYDVVKAGEISANSEKGKQVSELINKYKQATAPVETETPISEQVPTRVPVESIKITIATPIDQLPKGLLSILVTEYKNQNAQRDPEEREDLDSLSPDKITKTIPFKNWIQGFPSAHKIIDDYNRTTGRVTEPAAVKPAPVKPVSVTPIPEVVPDEELIDLIENNKVTDARIRSIAQKITNADRLSQGEDQIYKTKFSEIDKIAEELKPKEVAPVPIAEEPIEVEVRPTPTKSLTERFADITTMEQLEILEGELIEDLSTPSIRKALDLSGELIDKLVEDKRKELARSITFDSITTGEVLVMKDKARYGKTGLGKVMGKTDNNIKVAKFGEESGTIYAEPISNIEFKYNKGTEDVELTPGPSPEEAKLIQESAKNILDSLGDPANIKAIEDASNKPARFDDLDPDDLDC